MAHTTDQLEKVIITFNKNDPEDKNEETTRLNAREEYLRNWIKKGEPRKEIEKQNLKKYFQIEQYNLGNDKNVKKTEKKSIIKIITSLFSFKKDNSKNKQKELSSLSYPLTFQQNERKLCNFNSKFELSEENKSVRSSFDNESNQILSKCNKTSDATLTYNESKRSITKIHEKDNYIHLTKAHRGSRTTDWWSNDETHEREGKFVEEERKDKRMDEEVGKMKKKQIKEPIPIGDYNKITNMAVQTDWSSFDGINLSKMNNIHNIEKYPNKSLISPNQNKYIEKAFFNKLYNQKKNNKFEYISLDGNNIILNKKSISALLETVENDMRLTPKERKKIKNILSKTKCYEKRKQAIKKNAYGFCQNLKKFYKKPTSILSFYDPRRNCSIKSFSSTDESVPPRGAGKNREKRSKRRKTRQKKIISQENNFLSKKLLQNKNIKCNETSLPSLSNNKSFSNDSKNITKCMSVSTTSYEKINKIEKIKTEKKKFERNKKKESDGYMRNYNSDPCKWGAGKEVSGSEMSEQYRNVENMTNWQEVYNMQILKNSHQDVETLEENSYFKYFEAKCPSQCTFKVENSGKSNSINRFESNMSNKFTRNVNCFKERKCNSNETPRAIGTCSRIPRIDEIDVSPEQKSTKNKQFCQSYHFRDVSQPSISSFPVVDSRKASFTNLNEKNNILFHNKPNESNIIKKSAMITSPSNTFNLIPPRYYQNEFYNNKKQIHEIDKTLGEDGKLSIKEYEKIMKDIFKNNNPKTNCENINIGIDKAHVNEIETINMKTETEKSQPILNLIQNNNSKKEYDISSSLDKSSSSFRKKQLIENHNTEKILKNKYKKGDKETEVSSINYCIKPINRKKFQIYAEAKSGTSTSSLSDHYPGINLKILFKNVSADDESNTKYNKKHKNKLQNNNEIDNQEYDTSCQNISIQKNNIKLNSNTSIQNNRKTLFKSKDDSQNSEKNITVSSITTLSSKNNIFHSNEGKLISEEQNDFSFYTLSSSNELVHKNIGKFSNIKSLSKDNSTGLVQDISSLKKVVEDSSSSRNTTIIYDEVNRLMMSSPGPHGIFSGNISYPRKSNSKKNLFSPL